MITEMKFDSKVTHCPNCKQQIKEKAFTFQGLRICETCVKVVQRLLDRAEQQISLVRSMYLEVLRVSLLKGELQFPEYPVPKDIGKGELLEAMQRLSAQLGGKHDDRGLHTEAERSTEGQSPVHPLRDDPQGHE